MTSVFVTAYAGIRDIFVSVVGVSMLYFYYVPVQLIQRIDFISILSNEVEWKKQQQDISGEIHLSRQKLKLNLQISRGKLQQNKNKTKLLAYECAL